MDGTGSGRLERREFLRLVGRGGAGLYVASGAAALLAACGVDDGQTGTAASPAGVSPGATGTPEQVARAIVGDVVDFSLEPDGWEGAFGFVTLRLHRGLVDGQDVHLIRTDTSDESFASEQELVFAPKIGGLLDTGDTGTLYLIEGAEDQPAVLSSQPGRDDYTPAWQVVRASWSGSARPLSSADEVAAAADQGDLQLDETDIVLNAAVISWPGGELPADEERTAYLGPGQLLEPPDLDALEVTFKLHECYPGSRYIVVDTALAPMAEGMAVAHTPALAAATGTEAVGRTNVFMNGIEGPGPMGFQPSVFDAQAGDPAWSPFWDHYTYGWGDGVDPQVLATQDEIHAARDAGDLDEFPGTPKTDGNTFTVNCPVPVVAPNTFTA
ncbi:MAG: hypothetical protein KY437_08815 [Actinobacteria bacterium]|nr:hypothetical protein [Actinomycetota bacterium]